MLEVVERSPRFAGGYFLVKRRDRREARLAEKQENGRCCGDRSGKIEEGEDWKGAREEL